MRILICLIIGFLAVLCKLPSLAQGESSVIKPANLPEHPRLLFNREGITRLKAKINHCDWTNECWEKVKAGADELLDRQVEIPPRGGNWTHWYACSEHSARLKTGKKVGEWQWEHVCTQGGEVLLGDPSQPETDYDGCVIEFNHSRWSRGVQTLGITYQITGDRRYAKKARDIILAYADKYQSYPLHNIHNKVEIGGGRVGSQSLDESVWLISLCHGADLVWETFSQNSRSHVINHLLIPSVKDVILPHKISIHNIQCWKNSAVGLVGLLIGDQDLINEAINNPDSGYHVQMEKGVTSDGAWWEGAWGYHFYTMSAIWPLAEAARNCGIDIYNSKYKSMFDAPLKFASPSLRLPAFSDSNEVDVNGRAALYELAYARYRDPAYLTLLQRGDRANEYALWFGEDKLVAAPRKEHKSANYPVSGYAILSRGKGDQATWLCMKYGPHGGGHGHPDKLSFVICSKGQTLAVDPGTCIYGLSAHLQWYKTSPAHNTLIVDEMNQKAVDGKHLALGNDKGVDYVVAEAGPIYEGVKYVRTLAMPDQNLIVVIDQISCDNEHVLDIAYHQRGRWENLPSGVEWIPPEKPGYRFLRGCTTREAAKETSLNLTIEDNWNTLITLADGDATEVITTTGMGGNTNDRIPAVIFRRKAKDTAYMWAISLDGKPVQIKRLRVKDDEGREMHDAEAVAVRVEASDGKVRDISINPRSCSLSVSLPEGGAWKIGSVFAVR